MRLELGVFVGAGLVGAVARAALGAATPAPPTPSEPGEAPMLIVGRSAPAAPLAPPPPPCAALPACDCPPAFSALSAEHQPEVVEAWLADVERSCPALAARPHVVDCSEPPCLLAVDVTDLENPRDLGGWGCGRLGAEATPPSVVLGYSTRYSTTIDGEVETRFATVALRPPDEAFDSEAWRVFEVHPPLPSAQGE